MAMSNGFKINRRVVGQKRGFATGPAGESVLWGSGNCSFSRRR